jgi:hypothetical protein
MDRFRPLAYKDLSLIVLCFSLVDDVSLFDVYDRVSLTDKVVYTNLTK